MADPIDDILQLQNDLESRRAPWHTLWTKLRDEFLPYSAGFSDADEAPGERPMPYDSTGARALARFAGAMESITVPQSSVWHGMQMLAQDKPTHSQKVFLEDITRRMFRWRYAPAAGFGDAIHGVFLEWACYGTGILYIEGQNDQTPLAYRAIPLREIYLHTNAMGRVDTVHRKYTLTARQAVDLFDVESLASPIAQVALGPARNQKFPFLHAVLPRGHLRKGSVKAAKDKAYASVHIDLTGKRVVRESGYDSFPYSVARFIVAPGEVYGRSPASNALPDSRMLGVMAKDTLQAGELAIKPPLATMEGYDGVISLNPGAINPGLMGPSGDLRVRPIHVAGDPRLGTELQEQRRSAINDELFVTLFQVLTDNPRMTATEVMERAREKGQILGPAAARLETQLLGPMIEREFALLVEAGKLPEPPPALRGKGWAPEFRSPLALARRAGEATATMRTIEVAGALARAGHPEVFDNFDVDAVVRRVAEVSGMPADLLADEETIEKRRQAMAQAQAVQQQMQAGAMLAEAVGKAAPALSAMRGENG